MFNVLYRMRFLQRVEESPVVGFLEVLVDELLSLKSSRLSVAGWIAQPMFVVLDFMDKLVTRRHRPEQNRGATVLESNELSERPQPVERLSCQSSAMIETLLRLNLRESRLITAADRTSPLFQGVIARASSQDNFCKCSTIGPSTLSSATSFMGSARQRIFYSDRRAA